MNDCPKCGKREWERVDVIHKCKHIVVHLVVCLNCGQEELDLEYPLKEILEGI